MSTMSTSDKISIVGVCIAIYTIAQMNQGRSIEELAVHIMSVIGIAILASIASVQEASVQDSQKESKK